VESVRALERGLDGGEFFCHVGRPVLPFAENFHGHEILAENGRNEDAILLAHDFFCRTTFFFDEKGRVSI